ncbi:hypothetical protein [Caulobacter sp. 602-1]|uniref:hypothetical protein n=1 Tax=Caulobacter sp. 602-1 TaxID=2492472 RepID=UPI000F63923B|nr:hypothetical protein [Caulobacter sp. 602-1]RRN64653.1 hypothetical protein EIK80_11500 [Caulobacter sp. 602-1]
MASYMLIGGPSHGEIVEVVNDEPVLREDIAAGFEIGGWDRPHRRRPAPWVRYTPWSIADQLGPKYRAFHLMAPEGADPAISLLLFREMIAMHERSARADRPPEVTAGIRQMLADIEPHCRPEPD